MAFMSAREKDDLVDVVAQAVINRIEGKDRTDTFAELVVARVISLQEEERLLLMAEGKEAPDQNSMSEPAAEPGGE